MKKLDGKFATIFAISLLVVLLGGFGFLYKIIEFANTYVKDDLKSFGAISVVSYFIGVVGILFFTLWGVFKGHFRNIERPKYRMLELDEEIEREGNVVRETPKDKLFDVDEVQMN